MMLYMLYLYLNRNLHNLFFDNFRSLAKAPSEADFSDGLEGYE